MADNRSQSNGSNDISEMLRRLKESYENDKNSVDLAESEAEALPTDDEIRASLEKVFEEASVGAISDEGDEEDMYFEDEYEELTWFSLEEEDDDDLSDDIEEIVADEDRGEQDAERVEVLEEVIEQDEEEIVEDTEANEALDQTVAEAEEGIKDLDDNTPWYSDNESENEPEESDDVLVEEIGELEEEPEEDHSSDYTDDDTPWYPDSEPEA